MWLLELVLKALPYRIFIGTGVIFTGIALRMINKET
jgi:hypothetical protein